jgi:hypothetical protein
VLERGPRARAGIVHVELVEDFEHVGVDRLVQSAVLTGVPEHVGRKLYQRREALRDVDERRGRRHTRGRENLVRLRGVVRPQLGGLVGLGRCRRVLAIVQRDGGELRAAIRGP